MVVSMTECNGSAEAMRAAIMLILKEEYGIKNVVAMMTDGTAAVVGPKTGLQVNLDLVLLCHLVDKNGTYIYVSGVDTFSIVYVWIV